MDLEVVGRHAMLFDDDAMAIFSNSPEALVDWNSLSIDRYDVRHLLPGPLPPRPKRRPPPPSLEADLDLERYLDLHSSSPEDPPQDNDSELGNSAGYHAVAFSYENPNESTLSRNSNTETVFRPHFPVPENLLNNLPPNEKVHQIISRTAMFVSKHGSQSEIVLRVKQGDNPTFGFLMPDHHLHAYFRYLVDHQELLTADKEEGNSSADKKRSQGPDQNGGALSLLGSVYGSGEDEDGATENTHDSDRNECVGAVAAAGKAFPETDQAESSSDAAKKDESISRKPISSSKEKVPVIKRNHAISNVKAATATRAAKTGGASDSVTNAEGRLHNSLPSATKIEQPIVEPPSDLKRVIEKIVEFIVKNGKQFEAVLAEQDRPHGRFPFLLPSNRYHTYYLKVLQNTEESKLPSKGSKKQNSAGCAGDNNTSVHEESDDLSFGSLGSDLPHDMDRKGKFKMIIGKSKKDGQDTNSKDSQSQNTVCVDATAAAAILQAATRGIKNPNLEFFSKASSGNGQGLGSDDGHFSSSGSLYSSQLQNFVENSNLKAHISASVPVAKAIAETVAIAAAGEADSSEAHMTKEQKLKAERLKRAKMFAAMLKKGAAPFKSESSRGLSVEPPGFGLSGSDAEAWSLVGKEREGSSVPFDVDTSDKSQKSEEKHSVDISDGSNKSEKKLNVDNSEQKLKRKYRSRSSKHEEEEEDEDEEEGEIAEDKRDHKRSRRKHRSHRTSHSSQDRHKDKRKHHSSKNKHSHKGTKHDSSSEDEHHHSRHRHKYDSSSDEKHHTSRRRRRHREDSSSDNEHRHSRHRSKHYSSSDDEERHRSRHIKDKSRSHAEKERDLEEGEILMKSDKSKMAKEVERDNREEASIGLSKSDHHASTKSQSPETTEVSDELRAKIRAMLMANM